MDFSIFTTAFAAAQVTVEVATNDAEVMIAEINGHQIGCRALTVNEARPRGHGSRRDGFNVRLAL